MKRVAVFDDAIITSLVPYGDADVVVRLFTRDRGRVAAFARNARRSQKRFGGLTAPARARVGLIEKSSDLLTLDEVDVDASLFPLAEDAKALGFAAYVVELVERLVPEGAPVPLLYALTDRALAAIVALGPLAAVLRAFELQLVHELGSLPDLSDPALPLDPAARAAAIALLQADLGAPPEVAPPTLRQVGRLFAAYLREAGVKPLKSVAYLRSLRG